MIVMQMKDAIIIITTTEIKKITEMAMVVNSQIDI